MRLTIGRRDRVISQASNPANSGTTITMPPISSHGTRRRVDDVARGNKNTSWLRSGFGGCAVG
jgi:hypothetical protein